MNAERLYFIAKELQNEFEKLDITASLKLIVNIFEKYKKDIKGKSEQNNDNDYENILHHKVMDKDKVNKILSEVSVHLDKSIANYCIKSYRDELQGICIVYEKYKNSQFTTPNYNPTKEIFLFDYIGFNLKTKICQTTDSFFNEFINIGRYANELNDLILAVREVNKTISGIVSGLSFYDRKKTTYSYCEIILTIPRQQVQENLKNLGQELISFEKNLSVFSEIATGSREPVRVKTIASSEFSIFLESAPAIGACIALAVERIIALYKASLEIKKIKLELEKHKVPDEISALLDKHVNSIVSAAAEKIAAEVMEKHAARLEENRKNELLIELRHSIENLAEKIDKGFQIEVSVAEVGEEKKEPGGQLTADEIARKQIAESAKKITYPISSCDPVPALPEKETGTEE